MMTSCLPLKSMPPNCGAGVGVYVPIMKPLLKITVPLEPQAVFIASQLDTSVSRRRTTTAVVFATRKFVGELASVTEGSTVQDITPSAANGKDKEFAVELTDVVPPVRACSLPARLDAPSEVKIVTSPTVVDELPATNEADTLVVVTVTAPFDVVVVTVLPSELSRIVVPSGRAAIVMPPSVGDAVGAAAAAWLF
jgi:hypothetical protein